MSNFATKAISVYNSLFSEYDSNLNLTFYLIKFPIKFLMTVIVPFRSDIIKDNIFINKVSSVTI